MLWKLILYHFVMMIISGILAYFSSRAAFSHHPPWLFRICTFFTINMTFVELLELIRRIAEWNNCDVGNYCYMFWGFLVLSAWCAYFWLELLQMLLGCTSTSFYPSTLIVIMLSISVLLKPIIIVDLCIHHQPPLVPPLVLPLALPLFGHPPLAHNG